MRRDWPTYFCKAETDLEGELDAGLQAVDLVSDGSRVSHGQTAGEEGLECLVVTE